MQDKSKSDALIKEAFDIYMSITRVFPEDYRGVEPADMGAKTEKTRRILEQMAQEPSAAYGVQIDKAAKAAIIQSAAIFKRVMAMFKRYKDSNTLWYEQATSHAKRLYKTIVEAHIAKGDYVRVDISSILQRPRGA
jgi:hypothetical protein